MNKTEGQTYWHRLDVYIHAEREESDARQPSVCGRKKRLTAERGAFGIIFE
jgi:hypothetical protein